jgi:7-cyano-7-deazaguanine synthase
MPRRSSPTFNAVVLLSGGLDSAVNLALAGRYRGPVLGLTFDYGQRAARAELRAARQLCGHYGAEHKSVKLGWLRELAPAAIVDPAAPLPTRLDDAAAVWVPNRNGVFVAVGASVAESLGARAVVAGFNAEEAAHFPDNSPAFVAASNRALRFSTAGRVVLMSYTGKMDKTDIVRRAIRVGLPWEHVFPCYGEGPGPCGKCSSCARTARALRRAGRPDLVKAVFKSEEI